MDRGILFKDRLVRRILDRVNPKTQTRRILKPQPQPNGGEGFHELAPYARPDGRWTWTLAATGMGVSDPFRCPYGVVGDRLWVREAWRSWTRSCADEDTGDDHECYEHCNQTYVAYRATPRIGFRPVPDRQAITYLDESTPIESDRNLLGPWKPGIHLRRDWARIWLDVVAVRIERLQDITAEDALAEGVELGVPLDVIVNGEQSKAVYFDARTAFAHLWCSVNGPDAWKSNPWVWVVEFKRADAQERAA
jgi:hypothetical protein